MRWFQGLTVLVALVLVTVAGVGSVAAHDTVPVEPGASGSCDTAGGDGGSFEAHVGDDSLSHTDPQEARNTVGAAEHFVESRGECGSGSDDYVEVHVTSGARNVQYCYSEQSDGDDGDGGHGDEPTDNTTAGAGAGEINEGPEQLHGAPYGDAYCDYNRDGNESGGHDPLTP